MFSLLVELHLEQTGEELVALAIDREWNVDLFQCVLFEHGKLGFWPYDMHCCFHTIGEEFGLHGWLESKMHDYYYIFVSI